MNLKGSGKMFQHLNKFYTKIRKTGKNSSKKQFTEVSQNI